MIENYRIQLDNTAYIENIKISDIKLFSIGDKDYTLGNFKSLSEANTFIKQNYNDITYIKTIEQYYNLYIREFYFKNGKLHNAHSAAYIETNTDGGNHFVNSGQYIYRKFYYLNNELLEESVWKKRPEIREIKLKRLLKENI